MDDDVRAAAERLRNEAAAYRKNGGWPDHDYPALAADMEAVSIACLALLNAGNPRMLNNILPLLLDVERLRSGAYRALHAPNQWMLDIGRERDELRAKLAALGGDSAEACPAPEGRP